MDVYVSMLKFSLSFLFGMSQLLWLPELQLSWLIPFFITVSLSVYFKKKSNTLLLCLLGVSLGFIYSVGYGCYAKSHQLSLVPKSHIRVVGKVSNLPIDKNKKLKFSLDINEIEGNLNLKKLLVSWYRTDEIVKAGQIW
jgi:hypothetical protein